MSFRNLLEVEVAEAWWSNFTKKINLQDSKVIRPTGLLTFVIEPQTPFFVLWNAIAKSLLAGNAMNIFCLGGEHKFLATLSTHWVDLPLGIYHGSKDFLEVIVNHPSIQGVLFNGRREVGNLILSDPRILNKKLQLTMGVHNSALVLGDADLGAAAQNIARVLAMAEPDWPISLAEIFVLETHIQAFVELLGLELEKIHSKLNKLDPKSGSNLLNSLNEIKSEKFAATKAKLKSEPGQYLEQFEKLGIHVLKDFSHCSTLHQESFSERIFMIQPVKYTHEMIKWVNAMDHGLMSLVFGPEDKVFKFGSQLPVNHVVANGWYEQLTDIPIGHGQHFVGIEDQNFDGFFFSNPQNFDGLNEKF